MTIDSVLGHFVEVSELGRLVSLSGHSVAVSEFGHVIGIRISIAVPLLPFNDLRDQNLGLDLLEHLSDPLLLHLTSRKRNPNEDCKRGYAYAKSDENAPQEAWSADPI